MRQFLIGCFLGLVLLGGSFVALVYGAQIRAFAQQQGLIEKTDEEKFQAFMAEIAASRGYGSNLDIAFEEEGEGTELVKSVGLEGVRSALLDPDSAEFQDVIVVHNSRSRDIYVCGFVNAKNRFGGYVGFLPFSIEIDVGLNLKKTRSIHANIPNFNSADPNAYLDLMESWEGKKLINQCGGGFGAAMLDQTF